MTVAELLARLSSAELVEWIAYDQIEPFGPKRDDLRAAIIAYTVAASSGRVRRPRLDRFIPRFRADTPRQSPREILAALIAAGDAAEAAKKR